MQNVPFCIFVPTAHDDLSLDGSASGPVILPGHLARCIIVQPPMLVAAARQLSQPCGTIVVAENTLSARVFHFPQQVKCPVTVARGLAHGPGMEGDFAFTVIAEGFSAAISPDYRTHFLMRVIGTGAVLSVYLLK